MTIKPSPPLSGTPSSGTPSSSTPVSPASESSGAIDSWPEQLAVRIAKYYYELGMTQQEIASTIGIGRARVIRLLSEARERGVVRIQINSPLLANVELAEQLVSRYRLSLCEVCAATATDEVLLARQIAQAAGPALSRQLRDNITVGLGWGITLKEFVQQLQPIALNGVSVVSLLGSLTRRSSVARFEATTELAGKLNAECLYLPAPIVCDSIESRKVLEAQAMFEDVHSRALGSDIAFVSIGGLDSATIRQVGFVTEAEFHDVERQGAIGNFLGYYINAGGEILDHPINDRIIGITGDEFARIPQRIMVSGGSNKADAIRAVLKRGLLTGLVTDENTAKALLD